LRFGREALGAAAAAGVFHSWRVHGEKTFIACAVFCSGNDTFQPMHKNSFRLLNKTPKKNFYPKKFSIEKFKKKFDV
jgi:hypothetical protein